jgi:hypothetical protein
MTYILIAATIVLAGKAGFIDMESALALGSSVIGFYLGAYIALWHIVRCCSCAEHFLRGCAAIHESLEPCQPHGVHRHHVKIAPPRLRSG